MVKCKCYTGGDRLCLGKAATNTPGTHKMRGDTIQRSRLLWLIRPLLNGAMQAQDAELPWLPGRSYSGRVSNAGRAVELVVQPADGDIGKAKISIIDIDVSSVTRDDCLHSHVEMLKIPREVLNLFLSITNYRSALLKPTRDQVVTVDKHSSSTAERPR